MPKVSKSPCFAMEKDGLPFDVLFSAALSRSLSPGHAPGAPDSPACNIHVIDLEAAYNVHLPSNAQPPPKDWEHSQYSVEYWLRRAIEHHPWRVANAEKADLIFIADNHGRWLFHCHMLEHHASGMGGLISVA